MTDSEIDLIYECLYRKILEPVYATILKIVNKEFLSYDLQIYNQIYDSRINPVRKTSLKGKYDNSQILSIFYDIPKQLYDESFFNKLKSSLRTFNRSYSLYVYIITLITIHNDLYKFLFSHSNDLLIKYEYFINIIKYCLYETLPEHLPSTLLMIHVFLPKIYNKKDNISSSNNRDSITSNLECINFMLRIIEDVCNIHIWKYKTESDDDNGDDEPKFQLSSSSITQGYKYRETAKSAPAIKSVLKEYIDENEENEENNNENGEGKEKTTTFVTPQKRDKRYLSVSFVPEISGSNNSNNSDMYHSVHSLNNVRHLPQLLLISPIEIPEELHAFDIGGSSNNDSGGSEDSIINIDKKIEDDEICINELNSLLL